MKYLLRALVLPLVAFYAAGMGMGVAIVWALDPTYDYEAAMSTFGKKMWFTKTFLH